MFAYTALGVSLLHFLREAVISHGMAKFCVRNNSGWSNSLHKFIISTEGNCRLLAIACLAELCALEQKVRQAAQSLGFHAQKAIANRTFSYVVTAFEDAVQVTSLALSDLQEYATYQDAC